MCIVVLLDYENKYCQIDIQQRAACLLQQNRYHKIIITQIAHFDQLLCTKHIKQTQKLDPVAKTYNGWTCLIFCDLQCWRIDSTFNSVCCVQVLYLRQPVSEHDDDDDASRTITTQMSISVLHTHMLAFAFLTRTLCRRPRLSIGRPSSGHSTRIRFCALPLAGSCGHACTKTTKKRV